MTATMQAVKTLILLRFFVRIFNRFGSLRLRCVPQRRDAIPLLPVAGHHAGDAMP